MYRVALLLNLARFQGSNSRDCMQGFVGELEKKGKQIGHFTQIVWCGATIFSIPAISLVEQKKLFSSGWGLVKWAWGRRGPGTETSRHTYQFKNYYFF